MGVHTLLSWLDRRLDAAVRSLSAADGAAPDPFRGLYVTGAQARSLLAGPACIASPSDKFSLDDAGPSLGKLATAFSLSDFDVQVVVLALAVEVDLKYEKIFGFLQDDVTRKRPTVSLSLNLFCADAERRLACRERFALHAPLRAHSLIRTFAEESRPLLGHAFELDPQIAAFLLGQDMPDERLAPFVQLWTPAAAPMPSDSVVRAAGLLRNCSLERRPVCLHIQGSPGAARDALRAIGAELAAPILAADAAAIPASCADLPAWLRVFFREGWLRNAILAIEGIDRLEDPHARRTLMRELARCTGVVMLTGQRDWRADGDGPPGVVSLAVTPLDWKGRRDVWDGTLAAAGLHAPAPLLDRLASGLNLDRDQIRDAVTAARHAMQFHGRLDPTDLFAAARARTGHALAQLARKVDPIYRWADLVLPSDTIAQLQELCHRATFRHRVLGDWGFGRKLSGGKGMNALFTGSSGTGKTMAAEVVANELELELYKINLATVVSKYIGETEQNLDRIFTAAESANAILFFDEADALFGKRSEVRDSHDRYANLEISYLLQKMEEYEGIAILASNLRQNLDDAFIRRLSFSVSFPFPDEASRRRIWSGIWPARVPLDKGADLDYLARTFKLSGGTIRNVALAASFTAAADGGRVTMDHLLAAIRREYQKLGKSVSCEELDRAFGTPARLEATA